LFFFLFTMATATTNTLTNPANPVNEQDEFEAIDVMEVYGTGETDKTIMFSVVGMPPIQQRQRFAWKGGAGRMFGWRHSSTPRVGRSEPIVFDPSARLKTLYADAVIKGMGELELTTSLPYFSSASTKEFGVDFFVSFAIPRPTSHFTTMGILKTGAPHFPSKKDLDNLVKFVFDALEMIIYKNDSCIRYIGAEKIYATDNVGSTKFAVKLHSLS
jgi:hypothetical protein